MLSRPRPSQLRAAGSRSLLALACALVSALVLCGSANAETARPADAFVDSIGVNTHLHYQGLVYDRAFSTIIAPRLRELGVRHVRDGAYTYPSAGAGTFYYARCRTLAAAGIRFNLITGIKTQYTDATDFTRLASVPAWCGGGVEAFEGPNEPDIQPLPAGSQPWETLTVNAQRALWATVSDNPALRGISVVGPSAVWSPHKLGDLSAVADFGNWHPYPGGQCPTCGDVYGTNIDKLAAKYRAPTGAKPLMVTETGYHNAVNSTSTHRPASEVAAGKYMPRLLLEHYNRGIARTYLYELIDLRADAGRTKPDDNFGLLRNDGSEKPAFRAVKSTIDLLSDPGPRFAPGSLSYSLGGATDRVHHTLLQKRDGTFYLALWQERSSYDTGARANAPDNLAARGDLAVPAQGVRVSVSGAIEQATLHQLRPDGGMSSSAAVVSAGAVDVPVSDRVVFVELRAGAAAPEAAANAAPKLSDVGLSRRSFAPTARRAAANAAPKLSDVGLNRRSFAPAARAAAVRPARGNGPRRPPHGTAFRYTLSERATLRITIERRLRGGRHRRVGSLRVSAAAGRRSWPFSGRVRAKALNPGRYRARVVAIDAHGARSRQRAVSFRIVRR